MTAAEPFIDRDQHTETFIDGSPIHRIVYTLRNKKNHPVRKEESKEVFKLISEIAFAQMVSREMWKLNYATVPISALLTVSDEAFALLTMENNVNEWMMILKHGKDSVTKGKDTIYRGQGENKDGTKKGSTLDGKIRFNSIYDSVVLERNTRHSKELEKSVQEKWKGEAGQSQRRKERSGDEDDGKRSEEEAFVPRYGFLN